MSLAWGGTSSEELVTYAVFKLSVSELARQLTRMYVALSSYESLYT